MKQENIHDNNMFVCIHSDVHRIVVAIVSPYPKA